MYAFVLSLYLVLMVCAGIYYAKRKVHDDKDFLVAGRSLSFFVLTGTLLATFVGSGSVIGGASFVFQNGPGAAVFFFAGTPIGAMVMYLFLAKRIRESEAMTIPELIERRYGRHARTVGSIIILLAYIGIVSYQFIGAGYALHLAFDIPSWQGTLISAVIITVLATIGGLVSVAYTDFISALIIFVSMLIGVPIILSQLGGLSGMYAALPVEQQSWTGGLSLWQAIGFFLPLFLLLLGDQNLFQRFAAATDGGTAKRSALGFCITGMVSIVLIVVLVCSTRVMFPDINPDTAMLVMAEQGLPGIVGAFLLSSVLALILTTGNSYLLSASANLTQDIASGLFKISIPEHKRLGFNRISVAGLGIAAYVLGSFFPSVLAIQMYSYGMYGAAITPALLAALLWKRATSWGGLAGMLTGCIVTLVWEIGLGKPLGWNSVLVAMPLATLMLVVVSLLTQSANERVQALKQ
ncbi:sodium:solute symporter family protein [Halomonas binhaiensis]|uniref:Sodium:solute symporter family protein n=1 Tax=Halomonas binhaiensis TaxID=2562282 RepID=A0A856QW08_9GAMM|nr:sodium:solute symporter family protein [Halomonas binhaiensis]QEM84117.2 sodium:solute symporter family protein [Halomonas binhaiensis]